MSNASDEFSRHRTRMKKIWGEVIAAQIAIMCSLVGIYLTIRYGSHLKTGFSQSANQAILIFTTCMAIVAKMLALVTCRIQMLNSVLALKLDTSKALRENDAV